MKKGKTGWMLLMAFTTWAALIAGCGKWPGNKPDKEAFFGIVVDLGSVAGAVFARYQRPVTLTHVLVEFLLQAARVLRQGVRERVRDTRQRLRCLAPKFRLADTPLTLFPVLTVRSLQHQPESV